MTTAGATSLMERTPPADSDEQALFEEARRLRRRRWRYSVGASALVAAVVTIVGLAAGGVFGAIGGNGNAGEAPSGGTTRSRSPAACPTGSACLFVVNRTGIVPIALQRARIGTPIRPSNPHDAFGAATLGVTPSGRTAYVLTDDGISPVNLDSGVVGQPLPVPFAMDEVNSFLLGPSGRLLYVELSTDTLKHCSLQKYNLRSGKVEHSIILPSHSRIEAISPSGATVYVATAGGADLVAVSLASGSNGPPISVPMGVGRLAVSANGATGYATGTTNVGIGDGHTYSFVTPIDLVTGKAESPIRLGHAPTSIVLAPNGQTAYVTGGSGPPARPAVMFIDLATRTVTRSIRLPAGATAIAISSGR